MVFKPGDPKPPTSGRKPGQVNRRNLLRVSEFFLKKGLEPVEEIYKLMDDLKPDRQVQVWLELLSYCEPRPKADDGGISADQIAIPAFLIPHLIKSASRDE